MGLSPSADVAELLQHAGWVRRLARGLVHDDALADDLVQETWLRALRSPPRAGEPARPWLAEVLRNVLRMRFRGDKRRARREEAVAAEGAGDVCEHLVEAVETQRLLAEQLLQLAEPYRSTLLMRYYEGLSAADIAARQKLPAATVRGRLKQGLERLRARLDGHAGGRGAWLGALAPLAEGRHAPGLGGAAGIVKGALIVKGAVQAAVLVAALGGAVLVVNHRHRPAPAAAVKATERAETATATATATEMHRETATAPAAAATTTTPSLKRLDAEARTAMLRRLDEARQHGWSRATPLATATASDGEPIDKDYIREQIQSLLPQMTECYTNALQRDPKLAGRIMVDFSIVGDPTVGGLVGESHVKPDDTTIADADMRECVQETMYAAQFRPPRSGGEVRVSYPFLFRPADDE
jgi:RNA polymerase sigma-70 factor (ECF subfamily)